MLQKLLVDMMSQPSRAVCLFCELNDIPYEREIVRLGSGDHKSDKYTGDAGRGRATDGQH